ncbi:MAG: hypothetical protein K0Q94_4915 [Paenibacillus sp.]|uniref:Alkylhydroperoxidase n=2 Tax=Paenibacillus hemerocallicola TaxID=1172614 RepID=A0A5C4SYZ3_9BACL|nr:hypothetical protein [Paenibacillus sp.]TNJ61982.1 alkylhydroperoxidase [Paenibacillus hemerocallicola]
MEATILMSNDSLYTRHTPSFSAKLFGYAPESFKAFGEFNKQALAEGVLSVRTKELIAVAVAQITGCPYCIEAHVGKAKAAKASFEELFEAGVVAAAVNAHSVFYNTANTWKAFGERKEDDLFPRGNIALAEQLEQVNESLYTAFAEYQFNSLQAGLLSEKEKLLVAVGSALVIGNPYSIDIFTGRAKSAGISLEELAETLLVATALKAGSAVAHRVNALQAYERD